MEYLTKFIFEFVKILNEMSPYLLFGFLIAGVLYVSFSQKRINYHLGKKNIASVIKAAILGVPLPLCSCGVIPTGISLYKNGASKGASVSFLISTPQTGVDSIMITYSLLGLPFAIIRPIIALITGFLGGLFINIFDKRNPENIPEKHIVEGSGKNKHNIFYRLFKYAFVDFLEDIAKWLLIGLLAAAAIAVIIPDNFFTTYLSNSYLNMLIMLVASIPLYVCATASVPIAAILILKGISPGAALVFLMAGPATNAATITVISKVFGKKNSIIYLSTIIVSAFLFGTIINEFIPQHLFIDYVSNQFTQHSNHEILPYWLKVSSSIILFILIINVYLRKYILRRKTNLATPRNSDNQVHKLNETKIIVEGMTCNQCKSNIENNLISLQGIENATADLHKSIVTLYGKDINFDKIKDTVDGLGYKYGGKLLN